MIGIDDMMAETLHSDHASKRICRTKMFSLGAAKGEFHFRYSRIHCLAKMPRSAAARLNMRLRKRSVLMERFAADAEKGGESTSDEIVVLMESGIVVGVVFSWIERLSARS